MLPPDANGRADMHSSTHPLIVSADFLSHFTHSFNNISGIISVSSYFFKRRCAGMWVMERAYTGRQYEMEPRTGDLLSAIRTGGAT